MKKYNHLTSGQRYTIDVLLQQKKSMKEICKTINISQFTFSRVLKRIEMSYNGGILGGLKKKILNHLREI